MKRMWNMIWTLEFYRGLIGVSQISGVPFWGSIEQAFEYLGVYFGSPDFERPYCYVEVYRDCSEGPKHAPALCLHYCTSFYGPFSKTDLKNKP